MIITVVGEHRTSLPPERATLSLRLAFEADDPAAAMREVEREAARLNRELAELRGDAAPLVDSAVQAPGTRSWRPWTEPGQPGAARRYEASVRASATFRDVAALGRWASRWGERDGWQVEGVEWSLTDAVRAELEAKALAGAVADARRRAEVVATAAGAGPVTVLEAADPGLLPHVASGEGGMGVMAARAFAKGNDDGVAISPEDVEVSVRLHVRFEG